MKADDSKDSWKQEMMKHEQRFKELHQDFQKRDFYV